MIYPYNCQRCGYLELDRYGLKTCPVCGGKLRRIYMLLDVQVKRGWTDVPYESRYENWLPHEKAVARERGG